MNTTQPLISLDDPLVRGETLSSVMEEAVCRLAKQLSAGHTEEFRDLLRFYTRFWTYSMRNCLLIQLQCPVATRCAGRALWNKLGYTIERGQKAIWIWAPMVSQATDPQSGEEIRYVSGFKPAPVFDFSQLKEREDKPLPLLTPGLPDDQQELLARAIRKVEAAGIGLSIEPLFDLSAGVSRGGSIVLNQTLDSRNLILTLLHELTHELWHRTDGALTQDKPRQQLEFEAEAVAFVAAAVMGLDHPSARDYLLSWRATAEQLHQSLVSIQQMVKRVLGVLDIPFDVPHTLEALVA